MKYVILVILIVIGVGGAYLYLGKNDNSPKEENVLKFDKPVPTQTSPVPGSLTPINPVFTFEFAPLHQEYVTCEGGPVLTNENGEMISDADTRASDTYRTMIPTQTFTPGERLSIDYEITCRGGLPGVSDELLFTELSHDIYHFDYVVGTEVLPEEPTYEPELNIQ